MPTYPYSNDIEVARLRVNSKNPRLPGEPATQRDAYAEMAEDQHGRLVTLARHIADHGLSPAQRFLVVADDDNEDEFVVLDGNRRLVALKALEHPEAFRSLVTDAELRQLKEAAGEYDPIVDVPCIVFESSDDADYWIELLHEGESGGAGHVNWSAQQKARFLARRGAKAQYVQVLDFVFDEGGLKGEALRRYQRGNFPVSTLKRILLTPEVRDRVGIEYRDGRVRTKFARPEVLKGLSRIANDIGSGLVKVGQVFKRGDRLRYIEGFGSDDLPNPKVESETATYLEEAPNKVTASTSTSKRSRERSRSSSRSHLIPRDFAATIAVKRINDIYLELKGRLRVDDTPNAVGVLLRVFLELSVDDFIDRHSVTVPSKDPNLTHKATAAADYMLANHMLTAKQLFGIREAVKNPEKGNLVTNLNALVHYRDFSVGPTDLKGLWDRVELFAAALWAN
jgi:hypothetical protein